MIYFDNNATTRPLPEVVEAMLPFLGERYANPSSIHRFGQSVRHSVECAREQVARLIGASPREIIFTSGGTESINLAIRGVLGMHPERRHLVTTAVEHSAVLSLARQLEKEGYAVDYVGVDGYGRIDEAEWEAKLTPQTALASFIHANNETGVIFDATRLAEMASARGVPVHVDAVQSVGKLPADVKAWRAQVVSLSAHKFHGPKGIGALYVRRGTHIAPLLLGGHQELGFRAGTENVAGITGMGVAAEIAKRDSPGVARQVGALRDRLEDAILASVPFAQVNGREPNRIYTTTNISFTGLQAEAILILLSEAGVCVSSGSACSSGSLRPSHVLQAMGIEDRIAHGAIRFSLSRFSTLEEVDRVASVLPGLLAKLTALG